METSSRLESAGFCGALPHANGFVAPLGALATVVARVDTTGDSLTRVAEGNSTSSTVAVGAEVAITDGCAGPGGLGPVR